MNQMELKRKRYVIVGNIVWLLNLIVLSNVIGEHGVGYLAAAFEVFVMLLIITGYTMPEAMAKLIKFRMQKGQTRNAGRVFGCSLLLGGIFAASGGLLLFLCADRIAGKLLFQSYAAFTLKLFVPAYILFVFVQIFRGYFQGMGSAVPTVISKVMEKIIVFVSGLIFCFIFTDYGQKVSALLLNEEFTYSFGSAGVPIGFILAGLFALLFLFFVYQMNKGSLKGSGETSRMTERYGEIGYVLIMTMLPVIALEALSRIPILTGMILYGNTVADAAGVGIYGAFYGKYRAAVMLLVMLLQLMLVNTEGAILSACRKEEYKLAKERLSYGSHILCIGGSFFAVTLAVLSKTLVKAVFPADSGQAGSMLALGSSVVFFASLSLFFMAILLGLGQIKLVLLNLLGSFAVFLVSAMVIMKAAELGIRSLVIAGMLFWLVQCGLHGFFVMRSLKWKPEWFYLLAIPMGTAAISGIIMALLNRALASLLGYPVTLLICAVVGFVGNLILLLALRGMREAELRTFGAGRILIKFGKITRLL